MKSLPVLHLPVPPGGRNITALEFTRLSIQGVGVKRAAPVQIRADGTLFVRDAAGRQHNVGPRA